jgi:hypothetical protein
MSGEKINKIFDFVQASAIAIRLGHLIEYPSDLYQTEVSYFLEPEDTMLNIFINVPLVHTDNDLQLVQLVPFPISRCSEQTLQ